MSANKLRILIVDDEPSIRNVLKLNLGNEGFKVFEADSGEHGLKAAAEFHPNLIILDLGLPDLNGLEVLKRLRKWTQVAIVILTVTDDESTKVALLDAGADDYLSKPFSMPELLARVRVALRHQNAVEATPVFHSDDLQVDLNSRSVMVKSTVVKLTVTEYELLSILVRNQGRVVPQKQLLTEVWGATASDQSHYLRIYIAQLRKKLEVDPSAPMHILTDPGIGYKIV